jgi:hypothetical protein
MLGLRPPRSPQNRYGNGLAKGRATAPEVKVMADYRAYIVGYDGHFSDCEARPCKDDRQAIEWAKQLVKSYAIELWCGGRFVVKIEPNPK